MKTFFKAAQACSLLMLVCLVSCGGNSSGSKSSAAPASEPPPPQEQSQNGQIVDSPVSGLRYVSGTKKGITTGQGEFICVVGQEVSFYIDINGTKDILLGKVECSAVVSPIELSTAGEHRIKASFDDLSDEDKQEIVNMLRFLQSLDVDQNPDTGIRLHPSIMADVIAYVEAYAEAADSEEPVTTLLASILDSDAFDQFLIDLMIAIGRPGKEVSEADALAHFNAYRETCTEEGCPEVNDTTYVCLSGYTLLSESQPFSSMVDTSSGTVTGTLSNNQSKRIGQTLIVIQEDGSAAMYRRVLAGSTSTYIFDDGDYSHFVASWSFDSETNILLIANIPFYGSVENYQFENVANLGAEALVMAEVSSAASTQNASNKNKLKNWSLSYNCALPEEGDVHDLGSAPAPAP